MLGNCAVRTAVVASFRGVSWEPEQGDGEQDDRPRHGSVSPSRGPVLQSRSRGEGALVSEEQLLLEQPRGEESPLKSLRKHQLTRGDSH